MEKIELNFHKIRFLSEYLKEEASFIRKALDLTSVPEHSTNSQAKTIFDACNELNLADDINKKKDALRNWIRLSSSPSQTKTVYDFIPKGDDYEEEKILVIRKVAKSCFKKVISK